MNDHFLAERSRHDVGQAGSAAIPRSAMYSRNGRKNISSPMSDTPPPTMTRRGHRSLMTEQIPSATRLNGFIDQPTRTGVTLWRGLATCLAVIGPLAATRVTGDVVPVPLHHAARPQQFPNRRHGIPKISSCPS